jgi:hypothetical protein
MSYLNINDGISSKVSALPTELMINGGKLHNAKDWQCFEQGWRFIVSEDPAPEGCVITAQGIEELEYPNCKLTVVSWIDPVAEEARRKAEKIASMPDAIKYVVAPDFRTRLRGHFSDLTPPAEQNSLITETYIALYFKDLRDTDTITANDDADILLLQRNFEALNSWWGTGETNLTFPWEAIP